MTGPWTLRRRLVLSAVGLLAMTSVVVGLVSVLALQRALTDRLDEQLTGAIVRSQGAGDRSPNDDDFGRNIRPELIAVGLISATVTNGFVDRAVYFTERGTVRSLTVAQATSLFQVSVDGKPLTVQIDGLGSYRVVAGAVNSSRIVLVALPLAPVNAVLWKVVLVISVITLAGIVAAGFAARWIVRLALRPLDRVAETATQVAQLPLDRGEVALAVRVPDADSDADTEVGKVGAAINLMLGHVASALSSRQESERKVRQFVADASHELRTPLASIRGYAELTRRGRHELPDDVVHAIGRVESEATRMTSLVEDLLLLARLDEGRDLQHDPVDLSRLLIDTVSDAHAAGPEHVWSLDLPEEPVVVTGDELRLHQVIANLLANARVHTPAGTNVTAGLVVGSYGQSIISVTDNGPGVPEDLRPTLFERFARGDSSRSRLAGSTGLGLAIVRAVVESHGGSVRVDSVPGQTSFIVELPATAPVRV
ncbi:MAG: HAMP domain-containing protein [Microbacteriaceae bacterium]|nr:HAMP domain-containing protein [Microbacteriaceae bacterium]